MNNDGTGMTPPPSGEPSGAVTSNEVGRKKPNQGKFRSGVSDQRSVVRIDTNRHGIRRETNLGQKKGRPKKV